MQVDETKAVQALGHKAALSHGSVEAALAVAQAQLAAGKLVAAADTLATATAGTEAAAAVAAWCEEARERAVADQALRMLRAHATALAASVV
ncbi:hypothetical protein DUNSADRAFT_11836 [Dunaliella salina]|uniref:Uncharacterized protein n=1 Tax=Dunaliella salina TaxID=3046 RepID=A0ABQ7GCH5_DUNSA|nr:hypothetical protein DUNSADRAFT_11836 [Dunaliella salina]|eukprot:KAF5832299.1 hypothetical protein DUNSADRAFT_11836 [Dunaliella salina]